MDKIIKKLYKQPLLSSRTGLFYNTFPYPTKISPESIAVYIAAHTQPEDTVLDVFGGSGSTAIAALMCEYPNKTMIDLASKIGVNPKWGPRNAIIYEIGTYGSFASQVMTHPPKAEEFKNTAEDILRKSEKELQNIYRVRDNNGKDGTIRHIIWSDVLRCPHCDREYTYYAGMVRTAPIQILKKGTCPYCGLGILPQDIEYVTENVYDNLLHKNVIRRKRVPTRIYGETDGKKWWREATEEDIVCISGFESADYSVSETPKEIKWGELRRSGYHTGITHLHHFYTRRNFTVMSYLWRAADQYPGYMKDALHLLLLSYNAMHSTLMTRVVAKKNSKDFILTGAQSGVLYISSLPVEKNILSGLTRKIEYFTRAFEYINKCRGRVEVFNSSSQHLMQDDASIEYAFTDPPFGDFIPYAEVNQINELWLDNTTERSKEIIISSSQHKGIEDYKRMMTDVFREVYRVLKDTAYLTVVYHASKASVWNALCQSYTDAGFRVEQTSILDKLQSSFKQVVSNTSVQGDQLIFLRRGRANLLSEENPIPAFNLLDEAIVEGRENNCNNERYIYANYVGKCLEQGMPVQLDAKVAYGYISQTFGAKNNG